MQIKEKNRCRNRQQPFAKNLNQYEVLYLAITLFLSTLKQDDMLVERMEQERLCTNAAVV